jgi:hypothetical protein
MLNLLFLALLRCLFALRPLFVFDLCILNLILGRIFRVDHLEDFPNLSNRFIFIKSSLPLEMLADFQKALDTYFPIDVSVRSIFCKSETIRSSYNGVEMVQCLRVDFSLDVTDVLFCYRFHLLQYQIV